MTTMVKYIIFLFLCSTLYCCNPIRTNYDVGSRDSANFSLMCHTIYPEEQIQVKINNELIFEKTGLQNRGSYDIWKHFYFKNRITKIEVLSHYRGRMVLNHSFNNNSLKQDRLLLIISNPYPKGIKNPPFPQNWGYLPIDSCDREIRLELDTTTYYIY